MDITLRDLNAMDEIAIRTRHSEYRFRVIDPNLCRGILTGGVFGEEEHDAVFAGASVPADVKDELQHELPGRFEIGGCALFYVAVNDGVSFMTTSRITDLTLAETHNPIYVPAMPSSPRSRRGPRRLPVSRADRLFRSSAFASPSTNVRFEEQGINMFAECVKR